METVMKIFFIVGGEFLDQLCGIYFSERILLYEACRIPPDWKSQMIATGYGRAVGDI
jgi:hypothetical protein